MINKFAVNCLTTFQACWWDSWSVALFWSAGINWISNYTRSIPWAVDYLDDGKKPIHYHDTMIHCIGNFCNYMALLYHSYGNKKVIVLILLICEDKMVTLKTFEFKCAKKKVVAVCHATVSKFECVLTIMFLLVYMFSQLRIDEKLSHHFAATITQYVSLYAVNAEKYAHNACFVGVCGLSLVYSTYIFLNHFTDTRGLFTNMD